MLERVALLHNHFDAEHLKNVIEEMKVLGAPQIRCLDLGFNNMVQALEGCHRLRACEILGITPELVFVDGAETVASLGLDFNNGDDPEEITVDTVGDYENYQIFIQDGVIMSKEEKEDY